MTVRPGGKKFGFQSAAENLQRRRRPDRQWRFEHGNWPLRSWIENLERCFSRPYQWSCWLYEVVSVCLSVVCL